MNDLKWNIRYKQKMIVASFDLGIKNLSYCVIDFDTSGNITEIKRWVNLNLLADGADSQSQVRCSCGGPASYQDVPIKKLLCKKCAKKSAKPLLDITTERTNKKPVLEDWRKWIQTIPALVLLTGECGSTKINKLNKTQIETFAGTVRLMPYVAPKIKKVSLQQLLVGMEKCLTVELPFISTAQLIRVENQPSEFAPHMKSVQIMLFTLLDHRLRTEYNWTGRVEFVNASVKTRGTLATTGKDGKRSRKIAAMEKVADMLKDNRHQTMLTWWQLQNKKDDLADSFLMCIDAAIV